jgi:predicted metalloprotease with PDZ domain
MKRERFWPSLIAVSILTPITFAQTESKLDYSVSFVDADHHRVHVSMTYDPETGGNQVQLPVWNALYQVRDFSKNVIAVSAKSATGEPLPVTEQDKSTWVFRSRPGWVDIEYDIVLDEPGPFGAQFNNHHAFLNLAELLMYPINGRELPITVHFEQVPQNWKLATSLPALGGTPTGADPGSTFVLHAANYDRLVDSPCEFGEFKESDFEEGGAKYRVVIDADPADYDAGKIVDSLKKITDAETKWMQDRPFDTYVFIYHFPHGPAGGGMEHAYSTAIDHSANDLKDLKGLESTSAHEFFHLWNVKRIRPQSLEPIDYTRENYTRALWFSEGVTSTVGDIVMLRSGLMEPKAYLERLSSSIGTLQSRPAHLTQSVEESSLDTWLDKYPTYRAPERSINYYNKGEILGVLLDLKIREDSHGRYSLRDLFQSMNRDYAKEGKFFPDSDGVRDEAEKLTRTDLHPFFQKYVAGTEELPYADLFTTVGLMLQQESRTVADPGFRAGRNFTPPAVVEEVYGEQARNAGIREGTEILSIDGEPAAALLQQLGKLKPGTKVRVGIRDRGAQRNVDLVLGERSVLVYSLKDSPSATAEQLARRQAWLSSEDQ